MPQGAMDKASKAIGHLSSKLKGDSKYSNDAVDEAWESEAIIHAGWLTKQGGNYKTWKRRWFVVRGYQMLYFKDATDTKQLGVISLGYPADKAGVLTRTVELVDDAKRKNAFIIKGKHPDQRSYILSAESQAECKIWMEVCKRVIYSPMGGGMFGCDLWEQVVKENRGPDCIPIIVEKCIAYLTEKGLKEPGIFRLPGRSSRVEELREAFTKGENPDISNEREVHAIGSLLKRYLRDLPTPLLSDERFSAFNSAADVYSNNAAEGLLVIQQLVRDLPVCNAVLLKTMCEFLAKVAEHSDENKMDSSNLAVVFAPGFLAPPADASDEDLIKNQSTSQMVTRILIEHPEDAYAMMPTPDSAVWQAWHAGSRKSTIVREHDDDDDEEEGAGGGGGLTTPATFIKPPLPAEPILGKARQVILTLGKSSGTTGSPKVGAPLKPVRRASALGVTEQNLAAELAKERSARAELEAEVKALRMENEALRETLATERAAQRVHMTAHKEESPSGGGQPVTRISRSVTIDEGTVARTHDRKDSNPFFNL